MGHEIPGALAALVASVTLVAVAPALTGAATGPGAALVERPVPCSAVPRQLAVGATVPGGDLAAFEFLSTTVGVGLTEGDIFCLPHPGQAMASREVLPVRLVSSTDGGGRWMVEGAAPPPGARPGARYGPPAQPLVPGAAPPAELAFSSPSCGWAEVGGELASTSDGGASWHPVDLGAAVASVTALPGEALAVTWGKWQLWRSKGPSGPWRTVSTIPVAAHATEAEIALGPSAQDVVVVTSHYGGPPLVMAETADGGKRWQRADGPCRGPQWWTVNAVSQNPAGTITVLCLGGAAGGSATHGLYVSGNRGRTWLLRAADTKLAGPNPSGIPLQDSFVALATPTDDMVYLGTENTFSTSSDGGRHWRGAVSGYPGYGVGTVDFVGSHYGWALLDDGPLGDGLVATSDGAHWGPA